MSASLPSEVTCISLEIVVPLAIALVSMVTRIFLVFPEARLKERSSTGTVVSALEVCISVTVKTPLPPFVTVIVCVTFSPGAVTPKSDTSGSTDIIGTGNTFSCIALVSRSGTLPSSQIIYTSTSTGPVKLLSFDSILKYPLFTG